MNDTYLTIGMSIGILLIISIINLSIKTYSCNNYEDLTGRETKYNVINGCFVKTPDGWIPKSEIRTALIEEK